MLCYWMANMLHEKMLECQSNAISDSNLWKIPIAHDLWGPQKGKDKTNINFDNHWSINCGQPMKIVDKKY